jgi:hypothetical protein
MVSALSQARRGPAERFSLATRLPKERGITGVQVDLVLLSLGGMQRFIAESRSSTADVAGASKIVQDLAGLAAHAV